MNSISDSELLRLNHLGIIPGPDELESDYIERAIYCQRLHNLCKSDPEFFPGCESEAESATYLAEAYPTNEPLYNIEPGWLPVMFSNYRLLPWHGGCAWIFQIKSDTPTGAIIQLRKSFKKNSHLFSIYSRKELIAHELSHVGRMMYSEPIYEELLAYRSSKSRLRRWLGPLVQSPWESLLFMVLILMAFLVDLNQLVSGTLGSSNLSIWTKALPIIFLTYALGRVWHRQNTFNRCVMALKQVCHNDLAANAAAYRLTDKEIKMFARVPVDQISVYANGQKQRSLRWRLISLAYFKG